MTHVCTLNDISTSGISFYANNLLMNKGEIATIGDRQISIVERMNLRTRYFYRAFFVTPSANN